MDRMQKHNQRLLRDAIQEPRLITSINVSTGRQLRIVGTTWEDYWRECGPFAKEVAELKDAWLALIIGNFSGCLRSSFVQRYFQLLHACLACHVSGQNKHALLSRIVGFEIIRVSGTCDGSVAAVVNVRHPVYLLSKLPNPRAPDNPKYLPLVCTCGNTPAKNAVFWHYRRIPLIRTNGIQLFIYPPSEVDERPLSHTLIGHLFAALTPKCDPWVRERSQSLFDGVFSPLVDSSRVKRLHVLDLACGSAKVSMTLCRKAFSEHHKSFDLTLVDVIRSNKSIAKSFHRNIRTFGNVIFRRENLFQWIDRNAGRREVRFDAALLLKACNQFSRFSIEKISTQQANTFINSNVSDRKIGAQTAQPATLIKEGNISKIVHGIGRFAFKNGWVYRQFSSSDYFKAICAVMEGNVSANEDIFYVPLRKFDEKVLVLPSGRSLIAQLLTMTDQLIIEDADLLPCHLERHLAEFALVDLSVTDLTNQANRRGAAVYLISKRQTGWCCHESVITASAR
jgi:hypothetical protein